MGKIPKWACTSCGMTSSRGDSVRRHVRNLHNGYANIVPFASYVAGINWVFYVPKQAPTFGKKHDVGTPTKDPLTEEFQRELARAAVRQFFPDPNSSLALKQSPQNTALSQWESFLSQTQVFGFRVYVCEKCQAQKPTYVCFPREKNKIGKLQVFPAPCFTEATDNSTVPERKWLEKQMQMQLGQYLESVIRNCFLKPRVIAIPIDPTSDGKVVIKSDADPSISIFFQSGNEEIINYYYSAHEDAPYTYTPALRGDIYSARRTIVRSHWLEKAVRNGMAILDDNDITDAAFFFHNATFGFVSMNQLESNEVISSSSPFFVYIASSRPEDPINERSLSPTLLERIKSKGSIIGDSHTTPPTYNSNQLVTA